MLVSISIGRDHHSLHHLGVILHSSRSLAVRARSGSSSQHTLPTQYLSLSPSLAEIERSLNCEPPSQPPSPSCMSDAKAVRLKIDGAHWLSMRILLAFFPAVPCHLLRTPDLGHGCTGTSRLLRPRYIPASAKEASGLLCEGMALEQPGPHLQARPRPLLP